MKAKNLFALLLCLAMVFALTACGQGTPSASPAPAQATPEPEETTLPSAELPDAVLTEPEKEAGPDDDSAETPLDRAKAYVDRPLAELKEEFGEPNSASYVSSCLGPGQDGELVYDDFTVITYQEGDSETVTYVDKAA